MRAHQFTTPKPRHLLTVGLVLLAVGAAARSEAQQASVAPAWRPQSRIVNGLTSVVDPTTVALVTQAGNQFCSGTVVGCRTVLTAAHCLCAAGHPGTDCQDGSPHQTAPGSFFVFAQHGGLVAVSDVDVPTAYQFGVDADVALVHLSRDIDGIVPTPINDRPVPTGTVGRIVGFGLAATAPNDNGIKRSGLVSTTHCTAVPTLPHLCWEFLAPLGPAGADSNTCQGDSGGPLFVDHGGGLVVAGVTSGGQSPNCLPPDQSWDADVFTERAWIENHGGADLGRRQCGELPRVHHDDVVIRFGEGSLAAGAAGANWVFDVPPGTEHLRVTLDGVARGPAGGVLNDFDLFVRRGAPPTPSQFDCGLPLYGNFEGCDFPSPQPGQWFMQVSRFQGTGGAYQLVATVFVGHLTLLTEDFESGGFDAWDLVVGDSP